MTLQSALIEDDLFAPPPRATTPPTEQLTRTRCSVCERNFVATMAPAKLCALCLENLDATRAHVARCVDAVLARLDAAQAAWAAQRTPEWAKIEAAMVAVAEKRATQAQFDATWAKRKAEGGPIAALLAAYEEYAMLTDQCGVELKQWHRAQVEINAAWMASDV